MDKDNITEVEKSEDLKKLKILYFIDFPGNIGGASKVLLTQAYIMMQRGHQVLVVIPNDLSGSHALEIDQLCKEYGLNTITARYPIATCMEGIDIIEAMNACGTIRYIIEDFRPNLIHSVQLNIAAEIVAREVKIPHLMNIYPADIQEFYLDWMNVYPQYHSSDSNLFSEYWGRGLNIPSRCIRVAYQEKNSFSHVHLKKDCDRINIIAIGVFCEWKNQMEIIRFILLCKKNGYRVRLEILGKNDNEYGERCKKFIEENDLQNEVSLKGFVYNVEEYLKKADIFILASTMESYPGVIVESMSNKIPIISTPVAGVPELLKDKENGFLTKGNKAGDIYDTFLIYKEYRDLGQITQIVEKAYITYLENHTFEKIGDQLLNYYRWILTDYHNKKRNDIKLDEVRKIFDKFIYEKKFDKVDQKLMKQLWLLYHIIPILEEKKNNKIAIWGAGYWGSIALEWIKLLESEVEVIGFVDTYKQGKYMGYPIVENKEDIVLRCGTIIIALEDRLARLDIMNYLETFGKIRNKDFFMVCNEPIRI